MRYHKIESSIWQDEKFKELSEDAKMLFLYIMTCPHSNNIGIFVIPKMYICCDLKWDTERLDKPFEELLHRGFILFDENVNLVCIINHLKHNPLENANQTKAAIKILILLPKSSIFNNIKSLLTKPFHKPLLELLPKQMAEQIGEPIQYNTIQYNKEKSTTVSPKVKDVNINNIKNFFFDQYKLIVGTDYTVSNWGKECGILKKLVNAIPEDELKKIIVKYLQSQDKWIVSNGHNIGCLVMKINFIKEILEKENKAQDDKYKFA